MINVQAKDIMTSSSIVVDKNTDIFDIAKMMKEKKCVHVSPRSVSPNLWIDSIEVQNVHLFDELTAFGNGDFSRR